MTQHQIHSVEDLTHLYRARRFWHTPQLNEAIAKIINHFGDRRDIPSEFVIEFAKLQLPDTEGWQTYYEPCPVVKVKPMTIVVRSMDMPPEILEAFPDFHAGGEFHVNKPELQRDGKAYHSRHGEYFYIAVPDTAIALPQSKRLLEV